jgi:hypothetical protein
VLTGVRAHTLEELFVEVAQQLGGQRLAEELACVDPRRDGPKILGEPLVFVGGVSTGRVGADGS